MNPVKDLIDAWKDYFGEKTEKFFRPSSGIPSTLNVTSDAEYENLIQQEVTSFVRTANARPNIQQVNPAALRNSPYEQLAKIADLTGVEFVKGLVEFQKSITAPPSMMSYARISYMPEMHNAGVMQWPGIPPEALQKVVRENIAPQMIINMRIADVMRYAQLSNQPWKPGWRIIPKERGVKITPELQKRIEDAQNFVLNCTTETENARLRDQSGMTGIQRFLTMIVRDSLTFDGIAVWTDMTVGGKIKSFSPLPAGRIRMTGPDGYKEPNREPDPKIFAVAVDDTGSVMHTFTRDELVWYVRNARADADIYGYGYPEISQAMRLIQGSTNVIDMGIDRFNTSAIPQGMLLLSGGKGWTQRQVDVLARIWTNLKNGSTKSWALPVLQVPMDGKVEILDMSDIAGKEVYYQDFVNMLYGAFATMFCFPVTRLGYRISGKGPDTEPSKQSGGWIVDEDDPGLSPLLGHIEALYNEYLVGTNWPDLQFSFTGKSPKEDAREYELRSLAMTVNERRAQAGLPPYEEVVDKKFHDLAVLLGAAPTDPALAGPYQSMAATLLAAQRGDTEKVGSPFGHKIDPSLAEKHGHTSGVRRSTDDLNSENS